MNTKLGTLDEGEQDVLFLVASIYDTTQILDILGIDNFGLVEYLAEPILDNLHKFNEVRYDG